MQIKNKNFLMIIFGLVAIMIIGVFAISGQNDSNNENAKPALQDVSLPTPTITLSPEEEEELEVMIEDHMGEHEDNTIMAMAGRMTPAVFYAYPGQAISLLNHEAEDLRIIADDGSFESPIATVAEEITTFYAPETLGTYTYYSSINPDVKGTIVVEE